MERNLRLFSSLILILLVVTASEMGAEGRTCESKSDRFKGTCVRKSNCASVCQSEGFPDGVCRGFRRRCYCTRPC